MDWKVFISTFGLIFVAELPDKTAFMSVLMAGRGKPVGVLVGACLAFVIQSLVAVTFGSFIGLLPQHYVHIGSGILFLILAIMMWKRNQSEEKQGSVGNAERSTLLRVIGTSFLVIFIAEWGDLTQIATAALAAKYHSPVTVFCSATLALWLVTGIAVVVGSQASRALNPKVLQKIAAAAFALVGILLLSGIKVFHF